MTKNDLDRALSIADHDSGPGFERLGAGRSTFVRLWLGETLSMTGSQVTFLALPLIAILTLRTDAAGIALITAAGYVPPLFVALPSGVVADRFDRRSVMHLANAGRILLLLLIPGLALAGGLNIAWLCLVAFGVGSLRLLFDSAFAGFLPSIIRSEGLMKANAALNASASVAEISGPSLGGTLVQVLGAPFAPLADAASFLISSSAIASVQVEKQERDANTPAQEGSLRAIRRGLSVVMRHELLRPMTVAASHFNLFAAMFTTLYVLFEVRELGLSPVAIGLLAAPGGVAGVIGAIISVRLTRRVGWGRTLLWVYTLPGFAAILVPVSAHVPHKFAWLFLGSTTFVWAFSISINLIISDTVKQHTLEPGTIGRATATIRFLSWGVDPIGALAAGGLASTVLGVEGTLWTTAAGTMLSGVWLARAGFWSRRGEIAALPQYSSGSSVAAGD